MRLPSICLVQPTRSKGVKSKVWVMMWRDPITKKKCKESTGAKSKRAAEMVRANKLAEFANPRKPEPCEQHLDLLWKKFKLEFLTRHAGLRSENSLEAYDSCLRVFERVAKPVLLRDIDAKMIAGFVAKRQAEGVSNQTIDKNLRHLRTALRLGVAWGYIPAAPSFRGLFVGNDEGDRRVIPQADIEAIVAALDDPAVPVKVHDRHWWKAFFQVKLYCGARLGEVLGLRWHRVDFAAQTITIHYSTSKGKRTRVYPAGNLLPKLLAWYESHDPSPLGTECVFPHDGGRRSIYYDWYAIQSHAGIPAERHHRFKDCRSTAATQLIDAGEPTLVVKDWLGHSTVATTERFYANTDAARVKAASRRKVVG